MNPMSRATCGSSVALTALLVILLCIAAPVAGAEENCTASGCHDGMLKEQNIHGPVRGRNCAKCHAGDDHPYKVAKKGAELCYGCHKLSMGKVVHPPIKDGDCTVCHTPHGGKIKKLLKKAMPDLCIECHDAKPFKDKVVHPPVADGCPSCHEPHAADAKKLLKEQGKKLCYSCHDTKEKEKHVHPPIKDGDCTGCHTPHAAPAKGLLIKTGNLLCLECHDKAAYLGKKTVHDPVKEACTNCHVPHDSKTAKLLKSENVCVDCHGTMVTGKIIHPPVESKECGGCHVPHTSDAVKLLKGAMPQVCFDCHDKAGFTSKHVHKPVKAECYLCHAAHSGSIPKLLVTKKEDLCDKCHKDLTDRLGKFKFPHPPVRENQCDQCHVPHASPNPKILKKTAVLLCSDCHAIGDPKAARSIHNPVEDGSCGSCHGVHGAEWPKLLIERYTVDNYVNYSPQQFGLCYSCHTQDLAKMQKTVTATEFRNGDRNLHYIHVNKDKGRNCRFCHDPHMSVQEKLIKPQFKGFGTWNIPIVFKRTLTGGSCTVGCHKPYSYDRLKPVKKQ